MKIYIQEDKTKIDFKYFVVVAIEFKNGSEDRLTLGEIARFFHMTYSEYIKQVAVVFNGLILDHGPKLLCIDEVFYEKYEEAVKAKEWIESMFVLREIEQ